MEVDFDVDVVLGAVHMGGAVGGGGFLEFGDLGGAGVGQFIRVLVQGVAVQAMRQFRRIVLCQNLLHQRKGVLLEVVDARRPAPARRHQQRHGQKIEMFHSCFVVGIGLIKY